MKGAPRAPNAFVLVLFKRGLEDRVHSSKLKATCVDTRRRGCTPVAWGRPRSAAAVVKDSTSSVKSETFIAFGLFGSRPDEAEPSRVDLFLFFMTGP